jgi:hypothetical protein
MDHRLYKVRYISLILLESITGTEVKSERKYACRIVESCFSSMSDLPNVVM